MHAERIGKERVREEARFAASSDKGLEAQLLAALLGIGDNPLGHLRTAYSVYCFLMKCNEVCPANLYDSTSNY